MVRLIGLLSLLSAGAAIANPFQRVTIQRGGQGAAIDCYIWAESPDYNGGGSATLYTGLVGATDKRTFLRFDVSSIPQDVRVLRAWLTLTVSSNGGVETRVHRVTRAWTEMEPTWRTFSNEFDPTVEGRFTPVDGRVSVDLTPLVARWVKGESNFGMVLEQDTMTNASTFRSSEWSIASERPELEIVYENQGPLISSSPPALTASCDVPLTYSLKAHAPRAGRFELAPESSASIDATSGLFTWTPSRQEAGAHTFAIKVDDGAGATGDLTLDVSVECDRGLNVGAGCSTGPGLLALGALSVWLRRRKKE